MSRATLNNLSVAQRRVLKAQQELREAEQRIAGARRFLENAERIRDEAELAHEMDRTTVRNMTGRVITRDNQQVDVIYVDPRGSCFVTPDGEGRFYYDNVGEAQEQHGDLPIHRVTGWTEN